MTDKNVDENVDRSNNDNTNNDKISKEKQFAAALFAVTEAAKAGGNRISSDAVRDAFAGQELSKEQYDLIFDYLKKHKIGVDESVNLDDYLTGEEKHYLADYLEGLKGLRQYTEEEKNEALMAAMAGEAAGATAVINIYLPQVAEIAKLYADQGVFLEDLIGEGNVALTVGAGGLAAMAVTAKEAEGMLIGRIMEGMGGLIEETAKLHRTDQAIEEKVNKVADAAAELAEALGRKVTIDELVGESQLSGKAIREALRISGKALADIEEEQECDDE
jgi:RNA polymerase primary sigma factor